MKNQTLRRILSLVLVAVMISGLAGFSALADGDDGSSQTPEIATGSTEQPSGAAAENPDETPGETPEETPEENPEETSEETSEETPEETSEETSEETPEETSEETSEENPEENPEETPEETSEETSEETPEDTSGNEEPEFEEQVLTSVVNQTRITISGLMPVGTFFTAFPVDITMDDGEVLVAFDITIYDGSGNEWQPDGSVQVTFDTPELAEVDEVTVYHMEDKFSQPEYVDTVNVAGTSEVIFDAESFSIYAITVKNNGDAPNTTVYTTSINQPVAASYRMDNRDVNDHPSPTVSYINGSDEYLTLSSLSYRYGGSYVKWIIIVPFTYHRHFWDFTVTLTDQAVPGQTYKFSIGSDTYEITAATTGEKVDHVDIRMADAKYTVTTIFQKADGTEISRSSETVDAIVKDVKWVEVDGKKHTTKRQQTNNGLKEFRFQYGSYSYPKFEMNATIKASIDLLVSGEIINVTVTFTDAEKLQAILDCDGFKDKENGDKLYGMDFYITGSQTLTKTEVVTPAEGSATTSVTVTKVWEDNNDSANARPTSLIVNILDDGNDIGRSVTLNAGNAWTATATGLPYSDKYTADEGTITDYTLKTTETTSKPLAITGFSRITSCDKLKFNNLNGAFIVIKKGNDNYVWTLNPLSDENAFKTAFVATSGTNPFTQGSSFNATFVSGTSVTVAGGITIDAANMTLAFSSHSDWSQFGYGYLDTNGKNITLTNTYTPSTAGYTVEHYQKEAGSAVYTKVEEDTTTGSGVIGTEATYDIKAYPGFTHVSTEPSSLIIAADGSLIIKLYYDAITGDDVKEPATLTIKKVDGDGQTITSGATFTLAWEGGSNTYTTGSGGTADIVFGDGDGQHPSGTYTLTETQAPTGYTKSGETWTITVTESNEFKINTDTSPNVWQKIWTWIVESVTGSSAAGFSTATNTLTVPNTLIPTYTVTYTFSGSAPDSVEPPTDSNIYPEGSPVTVLGNLSDVRGTNGTWKFAGWNKSNFDITGNTTITGTWTFVSDPTFDYSVTYHANNGTDATQSDEKTGVYDTTCEMTANNKPEAFTKENHTFKGWADTADGDIVLQPGAKFNLVSTAPHRDLYAVWTENDKYAYSLTYDGNGGVLAGGNTSYADSEGTTSTYASQWDFKVDENTFTRKDYSFTGWVDRAGEPYDGDEITLTTENPTMTLYATWEENTYAVEVTKTVTGAALPAGFYIALTREGGQENPTPESPAPESPAPQLMSVPLVGTVLNVNNADSVENGVYRWMVEGLTAGTYTATEHNYTISGMNWSGTATAKTTVTEDNIVEGNEFAGTFALTNRYTYPYIPPIGPTGPTVTPTPPTTEIPEESPPLNPGPGDEVEIPEETPPLNPNPGDEVEIPDGEVQIPDDDTPLADLPVGERAPQTGDNSKTAPFAILAVLSALGLGALIFIGKKKKHEQ